jgi:hypothetical protein
MSTSDRISEDWQSCPPGELQRLPGTIRIRERRKFLNQVARATAGILLLGIGGYVAWDLADSDAKGLPGGLACQDVMDRLTDYQASRLSPQMARRVAVHLKNCPDCSAAYRRMLRASRA